MNNKEVIDKLINYFLTQDIKMVARLLANCMIDLNRVISFDSLPKDEQERLGKRLHLNNEALQKFIKEKNHRDLSFSIFKGNDK